MLEGSDTRASSAAPRLRSSPTITTAARCRKARSRSPSTTVRATLGPDIADYLKSQGHPGRLLRQRQPLQGFRATQPERGRAPHRSRSRGSDVPRGRAHRWQTTPRLIATWSSRWCPSGSDPGVRGARRYRHGPREPRCLSVRVLSFSLSYGSYNGSVYNDLKGTAMNKYVGDINWSFGGLSNNYPSSAADWACWQGQLYTKGGALANGTGYATSDQCGDAYFNEITTSTHGGIVLMHDPYSWDNGNTLAMVKYLVPQAAGAELQVRPDRRRAVDQGGAPQVRRSCATCNGVGASYCTSCATGKYLDGTSCNACTACGAGQYQETACGKTTDTVCAACSPCSAGSVPSTACSAKADTVCKPVRAGQLRRHGRDQLHAVRRRNHRAQRPVPRRAPRAPPGRTPTAPDRPRAARARREPRPTPARAAARAAPPGATRPPCRPRAPNAPPARTPPRAPPRAPPAPTAPTPMRAPPACITCGSCDDGNSCTTDSCGATTGCSHAPISGCTLQGDAGTIDASTPGGGSGSDGGTTPTGGADSGSGGDGSGGGGGGGSTVPDGGAGGGGGTGVASGGDGDSQRQQQLRRRRQQRGCSQSGRGSGSPLLVGLALGALLVRRRKRAS